MILGNNRCCILNTVSYNGFISFFSYRTEPPIMVVNEGGWLEEKDL